LAEQVVPVQWPVLQVVVEVVGVEQVQGDQWEPAEEEEAPFLFVH
jgi:hypothetical protein